MCRDRRMDGCMDGCGASCKVERRVCRQVRRRAEGDTCSDVCRDRSHVIGVGLSLVCAGVEERLELCDLFFQRRRTETGAATVAGSVVSSETSAEAGTWV